MLPVYVRNPESASASNPVVVCLAFCLFWLFTVVCLALFIITFLSFYFLGLAPSPLCVSILTQASGMFLPLARMLSLLIRYRLFCVSFICFCLCLSHFSFWIHLSFCPVHVAVCLSNPVRWHGIALRTLRTALVVSLCHNGVTTYLAYLLTARRRISTDTGCVGYRRRLGHRCVYVLFLFVSPPEVVFHFRIIETSPVAMS